MDSTPMGPPPSPNYCRPHESHFCPCAKPALYVGDPAGRAAWEMVAPIVVLPPSEWRFQPRPGPNELGLPRFVPSEESVARAFEQERVMKEKHGPGLFDSSAWHGFLGEAIGGAWARNLGLEVTSFGGFDAHPDLLINGIRVGVKTAHPMRSWLSRNGIYAIVPDPHLHKDWDLWLFLGVVREPPHETYVVGGCTPEYFRDHSQPESWKYPCHYISSSWNLLLEPHEIFDLLDAARGVA